MGSQYDAKEGPDRARGGLQLLSKNTRGPSADLKEVCQRTVKFGEPDNGRLSDTLKEREEAAGEVTKLGGRREGRR